MALKNPLTVAEAPNAWSRGVSNDTGLGWMLKDGTTSLSPLRHIGRSIARDRSHPGSGPPL